MAHRRTRCPPIALQRHARTPRLSDVGRRGATCSTSAGRRPRLRRRGRGRRRGDAALRRRQPTAAGPRPARASPRTYRVGNGRAGNVGAGRDRARRQRSSRSRARRAQPAAGRGRHRPGDAGRRAPRRAGGVPHARSAPSPRPTTPRSPSAIPACSAPRRRLRWTGSWHTVFVTVDRVGGAADRRRRSRTTLARHLERYRMAGHDLEIDAPRYVSLEIALARLRQAATTSAPTSRDGLLEVLQQPRAARRPARPLPPRQLHLRPAGVPEPALRRGAGRRRRRVGRR